MNYTATGYLPNSLEKYWVPNPLRIDINAEDCQVNNSSEYTASTVMIPTLKEGVDKGEVTFGVSNLGDFFFNSYSTGEGHISYCGSRLLYVWGRVVVDIHGKSVVDAFAIDCDTMLEVVDVKVHFNTTSLVIDSTPSRTDSSQFFDNFFTFLTSSPWAIPASELASNTTVEKVVAAIRAQHGLIAASFLDSCFRVNVNNSPSDVALIGDSMTPTNFVYSANATFLQDRPRVVQDLQSTRLLQVLLALTLILSLASWCLMPRTDVIAGSPTSIACKLALAAGGNLFEEVLPRGSEHLGTETLQHQEDCTFILGWRSPDGSTGKEERFGIWALTAKEVEEMRARQTKEGRWTKREKR
ncbi:hypothetical protein F4825DRAFT_474639 [Nemania diffusa]|nr:hypothetical protein F4825DRAFT_474639 [Nemania diffusa]